MLCVIPLLARRGTAVPGAPLMISALTTSFCGIGAISDGSLVAVGAGGVTSVERTRAVNEQRRRAGLARAPEQARRRDIDLVKTLACLELGEGGKPQVTAGHLILANISHG
jgi:hypothetical protein